ncbi:MAG: hypothetical protein IJ180_00530 [Bacteroidales bacterium]|nr:hypothetical protein [Bacteroidales bacterium]
MITLYGKRNGYKMEIYSNKECKNLVAINPYQYYLKSQVITLNCWKYWLEVIK